MNWARQVVHVATRDVRRTRLSIGLYALAVAATAFANLSGDIMPLPLLMLLAGMLYTVDLIHQDSPYRPDAFWASKPLYPTAVFAAKALVATGVVLGCAVPAHALVFVAGYGSVPPDLGLQLAGSALVVAGLIFTGALLGAVTPNLRTFLLVLVAQYLATTWTGEWLAGAGWPEGEFEATGPLFAALIVSLLLTLLSLAWMYYTRNRRQGIVLATIVILFPIAARTAAARIATGPEPAADLHQPNVWMVKRERGFSRPGEFGIHLQMPEADPSKAYNLTAPRAELHDSDGRVTRVRVSKGRISLNDPMPPFRNIAWIGPTGTRRSMNTAAGYTRVVRLMPTPRQQSSLESGEAQLVVRGRVEIFEPYIVARVPLEAGRSFTSGGQRLEIDSVKSLVGGAQFGLHGLNLSTADDRGDLPSLRYALVNFARGEGVELWNTSGSSSIYGVLPSAYHASSFRYEFRVPSDARQYPLSPNWLRAAELVLIHWRHLGSYPVTIPES